MHLLLSIVVLIVVVGAAIAVMLVVRRRAPEGSYFADGDRASGVFGVLATCFAIFAGFVILLAFTTYDQSRSGSEAEALTVLQQFETAQFLPADVRDELAGEIECYGRSVVHQEWPRLDDGGDDATLNEWAPRLFRTLKSTKPVTAVEQSAYDKWLDQTSDREAARRDRVHGAVGIIPSPLWIVLFLSAGLVFAYMLFFADSAERARSQAMLMGSAAAVVVATLLVIDALDNPYRPGLGAIRPVAMERTLDLIDQARTAVGDTSTVPCDADGTAPTA
jgi:hypothetical protein